jgi:hypothetical protein
MARLSVSQIQELLKKPKNKKQIEAAQRQEQRLRLHCEPILEKDCLPDEAFRDFSAWAKSLITAEKFVRFAQLLTTPLHTVPVTKDIFNQLGKFLDAQDRFIKYEFIDSELQSDFNQYLEKINDPDFWRTKGMDCLRVGINSVIVVDLPAEQLTTRPEPYYYPVCIDNIIDVDYCERTDKCEYVIYKQDKDAKYVIAIDDEFYRCLEKQEDGSYKIEGEEAQHSWYDSNGQRLRGLGYTPAISFYNQNISNTRQINKRGPLTDHLTKLDWLLFFVTIAKYYFMYGPFPIVVSYEIEKNEFDQKNKEQADNTIYIPKAWSPYDLSAGDIRDPKTDERNLIGAGSTMTVPSPKRQGDPDMMENPIKVIEMTVDNLDWVKTYIRDLSSEIIEDCTGEDGDLLNQSQAKNADQIQAAFERKTAVLTEIKQNFERAHKFVVGTCARLRYSYDYVISVTIDYGKEYFMKDAAALIADYESAVKAGLNIGYTSALRKAIISTKYKNNPDELARQSILLDVEPYPDLTWLQMITAQLNLADPESFVIKVNFTTFIARFERENGNIVDFGSLIPYKTKIETIIKTLKTYGNSTTFPKPDGGQQPGK